MEQTSDKKTFTYDFVQKLFILIALPLPLFLHAVLVYFQVNYGLLLYLKLARVDVGNVSKKGKNMKGIITWCFCYVVLKRTLSIYL